MPLAHARGGPPARSGLPRRRRRHGAGGGHRRGRPRGRRLLPADRLGPLGAGDRRRLPLHRLHHAQPPPSLDRTLFPFQRAFPPEVPAPDHRTGAFVRAARLPGPRQRQEHLCAGQPLGRTGRADRIEPQGQIPFRQSHHVHDLQGRGPQRADLVPAPLFPRPRPAGGRYPSHTARSGRTLITRNCSAARPTWRTTAS